MPDPFPDWRRDVRRPSDEDSSEELQGPELPQWLAKRMLAPGEIVRLVRGPYWAPSFEPLLTSPFTILFSLIPGAALVFASYVTQHPVPFFVAFGLVFGTLFVVGFAAAHFTRLVVTNERVFIVQGRELRHSWGVDDLPYHLRRFERGEDGQERAVIDLGAMRSMIGGSSEGFMDADAILQLGKKLNTYKERPDDRQ